MAKVNVHTEPETPSQKVVKAANEVVYVTDSKGRKLGLRRIPFIEEFRIVETVGNERAGNQVYMGMLNFVLLIGEIDGERIAIPRTHAQIEALIQRAGQEGFLAAVEWASNEAAPDQKTLEKRIKNESSTPD